MGARVHVWWSEDNMVPGVGSFSLSCGALGIKRSSGLASSVFIASPSNFYYREFVDSLIARLSKGVWMVLQGCGSVGEHLPGNTKPRVQASVDGWVCGEEHSCHSPTLNHVVRCSLKHHGTSCLK